MKSDLHPRNSAQLLNWPHSNALWIGSPESSEKELNGRFRFEKIISIDQVSRDWRLDLTADSRYRLTINNQWVCDGPARSYPNSLFFDRVAISGFLHQGENNIAVEITHYGVDTLQYIRGTAGLLLAVFSETETPKIVSDLSWKVHRVASHRVNTPRISSQFGFEEHLDLTANYSQAHFAILSGRQNEKQSVTLRDVGLLNQRERKFLRVVGRSQIREIAKQWTIHLREHLGTFPGGVNIHGMAGMLGTELHVSEDDSLTICLLGQIQGLYLDGKLVKGSLDQDLLTYHLSLKTGTHWLSIGVCDRYDHVFELSVGARGGLHTEWHSPLGRDLPTPWVSTGPLWRAIKDTNCPLALDGSIDQDVDTFSKDQARLLKLIAHLGECEKGMNFMNASPVKVQSLSLKYLADADAYFTIRTDEEISCTRSTEPFPNGPLELRSGQRVIVDMEDITNGYLQFDVELEANSVIDGYFFEHLEIEGSTPKIQYLQNDGNSYRTSFRLTAPEGKHPFLSAQRRGFRYCMLTARAGKKLILIHNLSAIESLYQPAYQASFHCSDVQLNAIFRMSQRTLLLCMEDTFTDCPSYEQVFWIGDARNEMLFANVTFGAYDLAERGLRLAANSLRTLPLPASQCPSGWNVIIPSFSFLWVISIWENYWQSGRKEFLVEMFPAIKTTLDTALKYCTDRGLFSAPTWNFFDWAPIDCSHATVTHNSMLLAGALEAGEQIASTVGDVPQSESYRKAKAQLVQAVNRLWRKDVHSYPDAIRDSGEISEKISQHNSIFGLLFDLIANKEQRTAALANCLHPPPSMATVGSPFAMFFLLELLLKEGHSELVLDKLRSFWIQMLEAGSPTCWEMVNPLGAPFPTRSYCHGWSSAPVYLLPYLLFGIEVLEPGWRTVRIRPQNLGLAFVEASVCTPLGQLLLRQKLNAQGQLVWEYEAPTGVNVLTDSSSPPLTAH